MNDIDLSSSLQIHAGSMHASDAILPSSLPNYDTNHSLTINHDLCSHTALAFATPPNSSKVDNLIDDKHLTMNIRSRRLSRRSSHFKRWIEEQQYSNIPAGPSGLDLSDDREIPPVGTKCNPYLAYPNLNMILLQSNSLDQGSLHSYDVVDDDDIPVMTSAEAESISPLLDLPPTPTSCRPPSPAAAQQSQRLQTPTSLRRLPFFRSSSPTVSLSAGSTVSQSPSRLSFLQRTSGPNASSSTMNRHGRASSLSTLNLSTPGNSTDNSTAGPPSPWKWRPSVLGHFSNSVPAPPIMDTSPAPSRPSTSSTSTYRSTVAPSSSYDVELDAPPSPSSYRLSFVNSIRTRVKSQGSGVLLKGGSVAGSASTSSPSLWSYQAPSTTSDNGSTAPRLVRKASSIRLPFSVKSKKPQTVQEESIEEEEGPSIPRTTPHVAYSSHGGNGSMPRLSLSSLGTVGRHKKKKLIISGIGLHEGKRFEAARRWCESFGAVDQIVRMPNGDLHVHFRDAEVADTVCRVQAKVYIVGVGSVFLSWYTGHKRV